MHIKKQMQLNKAFYLNTLKCISHTDCHVKKKSSLQLHIFTGSSEMWQTYMLISDYDSEYSFYICEVYIHLAALKTSDATWRFSTLFTRAPHYPQPHQTNQLHTLPHCCFKIHSTIMPSIPWSNKWSLPLGFILKSCMQFFSQPCLLHVPYILSYLIWTPY